MASGGPTRTEAKEHRPSVASTILVVLVLFGQACSHASSEPDAVTADRVVVVKSAHSLSLIKGSRVLRTYKIAIGHNSVGAKARSGDHKTPEGSYVIDGKKGNSRFHRALHISYPNQTDRERAQRAGVEPGGDIEIHGIQNGLGWIRRLHRSVDWTDGCIAVTDSEIDEIWNQVGIGTPVEIRP
jgi:murein L,D-transpeptidase YafK